jgi:hypothetical protein
MVEKLDWTSAGATLGPVDDDEVRIDARRPHRQAHGDELAWAANAEFEAGRLSTTEITQLGRELKQSDWG